jgi:hypothetical protein
MPADENEYPAAIPNRFVQVRPWTESELELLRTKPLAEVVRLTGRSLSGARWQQRQRGFEPVYQTTAADDPAQPAGRGG